MQTQTSEEFAALAGMYRLLGRLWMREVDEASLRELHREPLRTSFEAAGGVLPNEANANVIEELAIDYCRLLIGPKDHFPPFQSVWQDGQLLGETTTSMSQFIDIVGYDASALPDGIMLDHFAVQLDVMGHIYQQFAVQPELADGIREIADRFHAAHLAWILVLLEAAHEKADSGFYRSVVGLTREVLHAVTVGIGP